MYTCTCTKTVSTKSVVLSPYLLSWFQCLEFWEACQDADVEVVPRCLDAGIDVDVASPVS